MKKLAWVALPTLTLWMSIGCGGDEPGAAPASPDVETEIVVIGRKLKKISAARQVIAITHLPQIAAFADAHIRVTKTSGQGRTRVAVESVAGQERTREIARMLGGATPSAEATAHADEMLRRAASPVN